MSAASIQLKEYLLASKFERLLEQWAREYGYGKADDLGFSSINAIKKLQIFSGWMPPPEPVRAPIRTESDKIEQLVNKLEDNGYYKHMQVLRVTYYLPNNTVDMRLKRLKNKGLMMHRDTYYVYLNTAKMLIKDNCKI